MDPPDSPPPPRRLIDLTAKARFVAALRAGAPREAAAARVGFPLKSLYAARARDPVFRLAWEWAMDLNAVDERGGELARKVPDGDDVRIVPHNKRRLQRRRMSWVRFTERRQQIFLDHFAGTADAQAAAAAAGVTYATVRVHYRRHPEFAALWDEALRMGYAALEAEALRQRLEAQRRLSENLEPAGEIAQEFERVMKLLARYDRKGGRIGTRERAPLAGQAWTFDQAIAALDKRLRALGLRGEEKDEVDEGGGS
ncbi:MAG: hypothetical protein JOZ90_13285 [Alphaproteobacteria bacterium]|nr:hypothetical protein [Alphaproteobacteria bacterium]MBV9372402.1 hypothetical protein [Alphaproteobacteria bacterium]MBV9902045.1 hypothetical protein [Alphaproteobacteria bacterium]